MYEKSGPPYRSQKSSQMAAPICFLFFLIFMMILPVSPPLSVLSFRHSFLMRYQHRLVSDSLFLYLPVLCLPCTVVVSNSFGKLIKMYTERL